jgi:hypothetical protein
MIQKTKCGSSHPWHEANQWQIMMQLVPARYVRNGKDLRGGNAFLEQQRDRSATQKMEG